MEILAINPRRKKRAAPKKKKASRTSAKPQKRSNTMPKKRAKKRAKPKARTKYRTRTKTVVRYRTRKAPKRRRRNPSSSFARTTLAGVNLGGAVKNALPMLLGALAGKAAAKKFAAGGAESDNWTWANYLWALGGGLIAALGTSAIFKGKRAVSQRIFEGALLLTAYKFFTNDVAPRNSTLESWFGEDETEARLIESAAAAIDPYAGLFGDITEAAEGDFQMLGQHYTPAGVMGGTVQQAGPRLGAVVEQAGPRLGVDPTTVNFDQAYG